MFDDLPSDPGDEDESEAFSEAALQRERALQALRVSVAKRWAFIQQDAKNESHRQDLESQMKSFLERVVLHYESVSFCPPKVFSPETPSRKDLQMSWIHLPVLALQCQSSPLIGYFLTLMGMFGQLSRRTPMIKEFNNMFFSNEFNLQWGQ